MVAGASRATVSFGLSQASTVSLAVFSVSGRLIETLAGTRLDAGDYSFSWSGKSGGGSRVAPGVYFIRLVTPTRDETRRVVVVK